MADRAQQALYLLALDPVAETIHDRNSYGFRKERSPADAIEQCFNVTSKKISPSFIAEGDIKSCFDEISHAFLLEHIPMDRLILRKWLKAGFIEKQMFHPTEESVAEIKPEPQHQGLNYRQPPHQIAMLGHTESNPSYKRRFGY